MTCDEDGQSLEQRHLLRAGWLPMTALSFGLDMHDGFLYVAEQYDQHFCGGALSYSVALCFMT